MRQKPPFFVALSLSAGLILAALSLYGFFLLRSRPGLPDGIQAQDLVRVDDIEIQKPKDIEFVLAQKKIDDSATFVLRRNGSVESVRAQFIGFYSKVPFPLIYLFIGLSCYLIGFTVFILRWEDPKARLLYWLALIFAYPLIVSGGTYILGHGWFSYIPVVFFYLFYPLAPALLFLPEVAPRAPSDLSPFACLRRLLRRSRADRHPQVIALHLPDLYRGLSSLSLLHDHRPSSGHLSFHPGLSPRRPGGE
jgi:hypothetical protein